MTEQEAIELCKQALANIEKQLERGGITPRQVENVKQARAMWRSRLRRLQEEP